MKRRLLLTPLGLLSSRLEKLLIFTSARAASLHS
jgi:hypothetical protein